MKGVNRRTAKGYTGRVQQEGTVHPAGKGDGDLLVL